MCCCKNILGVEKAESHSACAGDHHPNNCKNDIERNKCVNLYGWSHQEGFDSCCLFFWFVRRTVSASRKLVQRVDTSCEVLWMTAILADPVDGVRCIHYQFVWKCHTFSPSPQRARDLPIFVNEGGGTTLTKRKLSHSHRTK